MLHIPESFIESTIQREGENGRQWIANLPNLVNTLCDQWQLILNGPPMHGYFSLVVPVVGATGPFALKISWINDITKDEAAALSIWNGNGIVQLLQAQSEHGAMLLERLNYRQTLDEINITKAITITARLLRRLTIPNPGHFPLLKDMTANIGQCLEERWLEQSRPFSHHLLETAQNLTSQLGPSARNLLINYDIHYTDVLAGEREPWLAVDPKPIIGDPEYGAAQLLWRRLEDILADGGLDYHFDLLVETAELDPERAQGWTFLRCIDYWLWGLNIGLTEDPPRCEFIANWLLNTSFPKKFNFY